MQGDNMKKMTEQLLIRIDQEMQDKIMSVLNSYTREEYENKTSLVRDALTIGLEKLTK
jgi:hypothetical protein